jgi:excisionase family DNA binding protein
VADLLGVRPSTIYQWTHEGFIPHVKLGRLVRFRGSAIMKWIEGRSCDGRKMRRVEIPEFEGLDRNGLG